MESRIGERGNLEHEMGRCRAWSGAGLKRHWNWGKGLRMYFDCEIVCFQLCSVSQQLYFSLLDNQSGISLSISNPASSHPLSMGLLLSSLS